VLQAGGVSEVASGAAEEEAVEAVQATEDEVAEVA